MNTKLKIIELLNENKNGIHLRELSRFLKTGMPNVKRHTTTLEKEKWSVRELKKSGIVMHKIYKLSCIMMKITYG